MTVEEYYRICDYMRRVVAHSRFWDHVFAVGGCCRDLIMGLPIKDVDFAVEVPDGGIRLGYTLASRKLTEGRVKMFKRYCTSMLRLREFPGHEIEIVQTRSGSYPLDHPDKARRYFGTVDQDARMRDLTVNALYYDICNRIMLDPTGMAITDIRDQRLRTPSDPDVTLADDPLRVLRIVRFAAKWDWHIDSDLWDAMRRHIGSLHLLKPERVAVELEKIRSLHNDNQAIEMLRRLGLKDADAQ